MYVLQTLRGSLQRDVFVVYETILSYNYDVKMTEPLKTNLIREKLRGDPPSQPVKAPHDHIKRLMQKFKDQRLQITPDVSPNRVGLLAKLKF